MLPDHDLLLRCFGELPGCFVEFVQPGVYGLVDFVVVEAVG
jgi:hypothetical protein